jgi:hypothetical protein
MNVILKLFFFNKESVYDNLEVQISFDSLHERSVSKSKTMQRQTSGTYFHKKMIEQQQLYETNALRDEKKFHLGNNYLEREITFEFFFLNFIS